MYWLHPPTVKIYEALGAVADGRVTLDGNGASVYSSSGNKSYTVAYESTTGAIMMNDNASYFRGYLGYPGISFLMMIGEIAYHPEVAELLKGIPWKDINQKFKNDFSETIEYILKGKTKEERRLIEQEVQSIEEQFRSKHYKHLGKKMKPPAGY